MRGNVPSVLFFQCPLCVEALGYEGKRSLGVTGSVPFV